MLVPEAARTPARGADVPRSNACASIVRRMPSSYGIITGRFHGDAVRLTSPYADSTRLWRDAPGRCVR